MPSEITNRAFGFAGWVTNEGPDYDQIAKQFQEQIDAAYLERCKPLVEAVLAADRHDNKEWCCLCNKRVGHEPDCIIGNLAVEARKLKGEPNAK